MDVEHLPSYPGIPAAFRTPAGHWEQMWCRDGTSDWNTCNSSGPHDEYHLPRDLEGWALDVGAHIGAVTVPLLLDNPALRVVAVEALPENVEVLERNLRLNGVRARAHVFQLAAGDGTAQRVGYGPAEGDLSHSEFIGSAVDGRERYAEVDGMSLVDMLLYPGDEGFAWMKIDCERCEYPLLEAATPDQRRLLRHIEGEHHAGIARIQQLLDATHRVVMVDGTEEFGHFVADVR